MGDDIHKFFRDPQDSVVFFPKKHNFSSDMGEKLHLLHKILGYVRLWATPSDFCGIKIMFSLKLGEK